MTFHIKTMETMILKMGLNMLREAFKELEVKAKESNMTMSEYYKNTGGGEVDILDEIHDFGESISRLPEHMEDRDEIFEDYENLLEQVEESINNENKG